MNALEALQQANGNKTEAARLLGLPRGTFRHRLDKEQQAIGIENPLAYESDLLQNSNLEVTGTSTYYRHIDENTGQKVAYWIKTKRQHEQARAKFLDIVEAFKSDIFVLPKILEPKLCLPKLVTEYVLTDAHIGMRSWAKETGADWDIPIARDTILNAFSKLVARSPASEQAIFVSLGDNLHYDSHEAVTPTNKHLLDVDSRYRKMMFTTQQVIRECISMIASKHKNIDVLVLEGNHDISSADALRIMLSIAYENNPRINVPVEINPLHAVQYEDLMLGYHHGHLIKPQNLPKALMAEFPRMFGNTTFRFGASGHEHHYEEFDKDGMTWRKMSTLAARDAYAARHAYAATRSAIATTYHINEGRESYVQKNIVE